MTVDLPPPSDTPWASPDQRPGRDLPVPVSVADGVALVLWSILGQIVVGLALVLGLSLAGIDPRGLRGASLGAVTVVTQSLVMAGAFAWLAGRGSWSWRLFGSVRPAARHVGLGLAGGLGTFVVSTSLILAGDALVGPLDEPGQALLDTEMLVGPALVMTVVAASLLAPLLEEVTFRGVLFQAVGRRAGWVAGVLLSSVVFSVVHVEVLWPLQLESLVFGLALTAVGACFALLFVASRSLVTAIVAHATFNGVQILLATAAPDDLVGFVGWSLGA